MKVIVTDADQPGTPHTQIFYTIASESNPDGLFYINSITGELLVQQSSLDREVSGVVVSLFQTSPSAPASRHLLVSMISTTQ